MSKTPSTTFYVGDYFEFIRGPRKGVVGRITNVYNKEYLLEYRDCKENYIRISTLNYFLEPGYVVKSNRERCEKARKEEYDEA